MAAEGEKKVALHAATVKDVPAATFIREYASHLKRSGMLTLPTWVDLVKTSSHKELAPYDPDWYFVRAASVARHLYLRGGVGVGSFQTVYGHAARRGTCRSHFTKASGGLIRHILQQLEKAKVIEKAPRGGRRVTSTGQRDLDRIAGKIRNASRS